MHSFDTEIDAQSCNVSYINIGLAVGPPTLPYISPYHLLWLDHRADIPRMWWWWWNVVVTSSHKHHNYWWMREHISQLLVAQGAHFTNVTTSRVIVLLTR